MTVNEATVAWQDTTFAGYSPQETTCPECGKKVVCEIRHRAGKTYWFYKAHNKPSRGGRCPQGHKQQGVRNEH